MNWSTNFDYERLFLFSVKHNIEAIVWDELQNIASEKSVKSECQLTKVQKLQWALATERIEQKYARQKSVIAKLATFFAEHNIKIMILKGYGLSLNYPNPNHRPCSDIDIWLFEEFTNSDGQTSKRGVQQKADKLLREYFNIEIDEDKHHHTVFYVDGIMVENHYDFLNIHAHLSNRIIEAQLQKLTQQEMEYVDVDNAKVYIPSPDFHALFMLRHSASHFAAERIVIRHLLDWRYFIEKYHHRIDWNGLYAIAMQTNMHCFFDCINAICIDKLGLPSNCVPAFDRNIQLEERVWKEIYNPNFLSLNLKMRDILGRGDICFVDGGPIVGNII